MANQKISQLTPYSGLDVIATDLLPIVDTTNSQTKSIAFDEFTSAVLTTVNFLAKTGGSMVGDLNFEDNYKATFGDGSDFEIYHDGTYSYVGSLKFDADGHIVDPVTINAALNVGGTVTATGLDMNGDADFSGNINLSKEDFTILQRTNDTGLLFLQGGLSSVSSSTLALYGGTHPTLPNWTVLDGDTMLFRPVDNSPEYMRFEDGTGAVFNETGEDLDFRIESDTNTHAFFLQGSDGYVGIGTSTPRSQVHIYGAGQATAELADAGDMGGILRVSGSGSAANTGGGIIFASQQSDDTPTAGMAAIKSLLSDGNTNTIGDLAFSLRSAVGDTALTERIRIKHTGDVGINTDSPQTNLHVDAGTKNYTGTTPNASSYAVYIKSGAAGATGVALGAHNSTPSIQGMGTGTAYNLALCPANGSVAIGHTNPSAKLDVNGAAAINDTLLISRAAVAPKITFENSSYAGGDGGIGYFNSGSLVFDTDGEEVMRIDSDGVTKAQSYAETYVTLSGTTPTITCTAGNFFGLNTTGNTTFTFASAPASGTGYGFSLRLTAGGTHTLTWPASVKWPGGTAPDNPASGETNIYAFVTHDGGTTWYGMVGGEAFA